MNKCRKFLTTMDIAKNTYPERAVVTFQKDRSNNIVKARVKGQYQAGIKRSTASKLIKDMDQYYSNSGIIRCKPPKRALVPVKTYAKYMIHVYDEPFKNVNYQKNRKLFYKQLITKIRTLENQLLRLKLQYRNLLANYGFDKRDLLAIKGKSIKGVRDNGQIVSFTPKPILLGSNKVINSRRSDKMCWEAHIIDKNLKRQSIREAKMDLKIREREHIYPTHSKILNKYYYKKVSYIEKHSKKTSYFSQCKAADQFDKLWRKNENIDLTNINGIIEGF